MGVVLIQKRIGYGDAEREGSITVFLTLVFGLIFSLVGVTLEHARHFTIEGYVARAADSAASAVFGNYTRELYDEYGLFAYGGYDGISMESLMDEFQEAICQNLAISPEEGQEYISLYQVQELESKGEEQEVLTDKKVFYSQLKKYLKTNAFSDVSDRLLKAYSDAGSHSNQTGVKENLEMTSDYEHGKYKEGQKADDNDNRGEEQGKNNSVEYGEQSEVRDTAGGNPLEALEEIIRDGILSLVCDEKALSEKTIEPGYKEGGGEPSEEDLVPKGEKEEDRQAEEKEDFSAADYLKRFLGNPTELSDSTGIEKTKEKAGLICYAQQVFGSYTEKSNNVMQYGLEYMVSGSRVDKINLSKVVNRLLVIRMAFNYAYAVSDGVLKGKSLTTATEIAGVFGVPALIKAIQYTILLILSLEESCIDVVALLEGKEVPLIKTKDTFQMRYEEICIATRSLFQEKAAKWNRTGEERVAGSFSYKQYLWIFMLMTSEEKLRIRCYDLIQFDLRERYNQTFSLDQCITGLNYHVAYYAPYLFQRLSVAGKMAGVKERQISLWYRYS